MDGNERRDIRLGLTVDIVLKQDQRTGRLTRGVVKDILTKSSYHLYGIKVRLETGEVGRFNKVIQKAEYSVAGTEAVFRTDSDGACDMLAGPGACTFCCGRLPTLMYEGKSVAPCAPVG